MFRNQLNCKEIIRSFFFNILLQSKVSLRAEKIRSARSRSLPETFPASIGCAANKVSALLGAPLLHDITGFDALNEAETPMDSVESLRLISSLAESEIRGQ